MQFLKNQYSRLINTQLKINTRSTQHLYREIPKLYVTDHANGDPHFWLGAKSRSLANINAPRWNSVTEIETFTSNDDFSRLCNLDREKVMQW